MYMYLYFVEKPRDPRGVARYFSGVWLRTSLVFGSVLFDLFSFFFFVFLSFFSIKKNCTSLGFGSDFSDFFSTFFRFLTLTIQ